MLGIVISFDKTTRKGIVWCEDQKDLAIIDVALVLRHDGIELSPGDQFIFQDKLSNGVRKITKIEQYFANSAQFFTPDPTKLIREARAKAACTSLKEVG